MIDVLVALSNPGRFAFRDPLAERGGASTAGLGGTAQGRRATSWDDQVVFGPRAGAWRSFYRLSAFDVVLPTPIPGKGELLNQLSAKWLAWIETNHLSNTHSLATEPVEVERVLTAEGLPPADAAVIAPRSMVVERCNIVPIECVARGYLDGSGWREYLDTGTVCGVDLPPGLRRGDRLPAPIFTPATKAEQGAHDENIDFDRACAMVGGEVMEEVRRRTLAIYEAAHAYALERGVILADTKFEFGRAASSGGEQSASELLLADEALTPDSSRYWPVERWSPGGAQESFDKQYVREYLQGLVDEGVWDQAAPGPGLGEDVVAGTVARYRRAGEMLFGGVGV